jgi:hypothetical protein
MYKIKFKTTSDYWLPMECSFSTEFSARNYIRLMLVPGEYQIIREIRTHEVIDTVTKS